MTENKNTMPALQVTGKEQISGYEFIGIEGGFGQYKKAMLVKDIASIHGKEVKHINLRINENITRFKNGIDILDLKSEVRLTDSEIQQFGFSQNQINASKNIYLLSERGYAKLLKILEDDKAWEIYDELVDNYFAMRKNQAPQTMKEALLLALAQQEELEALQLENTQQKQQLIEYEPKVTYYDQILNSSGTITVTQIAKDYGLSAIRLNKLLHKLGVQFKQSNQWFLYHNYAVMGYTKSKTFLDSDGKTHMSTKWTQKGRLFLYDLLKRNNILPIMDMEQEM